MRVSRRNFLCSTAAGSMVIGLSGPASASAVAMPAPPDANGERMAVAEAARFRPYRSRPSSTPNATAWVQIDLGQRRTIDTIKLYPAESHLISGDGFPLRFRLECSDDPEFRKARLLVDRSRRDYPDCNDHILEFEVENASARYVRLTATRLRPGKPPRILSTLPAELTTPVRAPIAAAHVLSIAKIEILSQGADLAMHKPVQVDETFGVPENAQQLTRSRRPQGEGLITDNPANVSAPASWRPPSARAMTPAGDVRLSAGLFKTALENNIAYLLAGFTTDDYLHPFRARAGLPAPRSARQANVFEAFWVDDLAGSNAGRFLMGAGNSLKWVEHDELRKRTSALVEGIAACRESDGYIMGFPKQTFFASERGAYTRAWLTHGLIDAGDAGVQSAFGLLRGFYDWYNRSHILPEAFRGCIQGGQGMVANTRVYFTPEGRGSDIQTIQRFFQENYWLEALAKRDVDAIWQYPYDRPHAYLLTNLEAYLDLYRATGDERYLEAVKGGWDLFRDNWQNIGGTFAIKELQPNVPRSLPLYDALGETCGTVFWILLNHRLHLLFPEQEKYAAEIEKSIYNVILANQAGADGIRYNTMLVGRKEPPHFENTCCEGQGTRMLASLPGYIYSVADDGLYVNLYEPSAIEWNVRGRPMRLEMETSFPSGASVRLRVRADAPVSATLRIRVPGWAREPMRIVLDGRLLGVGQGGTYFPIDRLWSGDEVVTFELPIGVKQTRYEGVDRINGRERFAFEYGPVLLAALGAAETELELNFTRDAMQAGDKMTRVNGPALEFSLAGLISSTRFVPYYAVNTETFTCFPMIEAKAGL